MLPQKPVKQCWLMWCELVVPSVTAAAILNSGHEKSREVFITQALLAQDISK